MSENIGFIGVGTISEAMIRGLLAQPACTTRVIVSPRNEDISRRLSSEFDAVEVASSNQEVVNKADLLFLAIRPQVAEQVIRELSFKPGQRVVSVIAATSIERLSEWIGVDLPITQAIPLPFVAERNGVTAIYPPNPQVAELFNTLGTAIECESKDEYDLLAIASALMATYFGFMHTTTQWFVQQGLPEEKAKKYLAPLFSNLSQVALTTEESFESLSRSFATKGGLNEQVFLDFANFGGSDAIKRALDRVQARVKAAP